MRDKLTSQNIKNNTIVKACKELIIEEGELIVAKSPLCFLEVKP